MENAGEGQDGASGAGDWTGLSLGEQAELARAPKRGGWRGVAGDLWNAPNEVIGKTAGYLGHAAGQVAHAYAPERFSKPEIRRHPDRTDFINNPVAAGGAVTIGGNVIYGDDPYSPKGRQAWRRTEEIEGHPVWEHERQHIAQGRLLGPLYLPSNILGLAASVLLDRDAPILGHGPHNWNEVGPQMNPPRPWP